MQEVTLCWRDRMERPCGGGKALGPQGEGERLSHHSSQAQPSGHPTKAADIRMHPSWMFQHQPPSSCGHMKDPHPGQPTKILRNNKLVVV